MKRALTLCICVLMGHSVAWTQLRTDVLSDPDILFVASTTGIIKTTNGGAAELFIQRDGGDLLLCALDQGSVGIGISGTGTLPAGYRLAVDGKAIFEEVRVELSGNWPDYVFEENYRLMPLPELESEIKRLGHLPGFPSARQYEREGADLGETQRLMMEKIEELTLYVIELKKEIDELKYRGQ